MKPQTIKYPVRYDAESGMILDAENKSLADMRGLAWMKKGRTLKEAGIYFDNMGSLMAESFNASQK